jgi:signal transduction histidine kinase
VSEQGIGEIDGEGDNPILGAPRYQLASADFLSGTLPSDIICMNTATPFPWPGISAGHGTETNFGAIFEHAPYAAARVSSEGVIVEMNLAFRQIWDSTFSNIRSKPRSLHLSDLIAPEERKNTDIMLCELFASRRKYFKIDSIFGRKNQGWKNHGSKDQASTDAENDGQENEGQGIDDQGNDDQENDGLGNDGLENDQPIGIKWTLWRERCLAEDNAHALLIAELPNEAAQPVETLLQAERWVAIGRLAGGVVHDFNNVLTGVMLYCDLLLTSLDARDRRRRYADEIRSATVQASGLIRQLLVFSRPQNSPARPISLNEVAAGMRDLLVRLIGENIALELRLDPELGAVEIDPSQAQQILLNLVLNSRDALPKGGRITIETSNCRFQPVAGTSPQSDPPVFPCVLLVVTDNGQGMDARTRQHLFEPFFTTKNAGKGTGLGLTSVRSIVTTNRGLIHFDSESGRGTRVMILLPRVPGSASTDSINRSIPDSTASPTAPHQNKKESLI